MQNRIKLMEIGDMGLQIFDISKQILSGEEINIDLLVGLKLTILSRRFLK